MTTNLFVCQIIKGDISLCPSSDIRGGTQAGRESCNDGDGCAVDAVTHVDFISHIEERHRQGKEMLSLQARFKASQGALFLFMV